MSVLFTANQTIFNIPTPPPVTSSIVTSGSILYLDAGSLTSYPGSGTNWFDLYSNVTGSLINGPTYTSAGNASSINLDGTNDYIYFNPSSSLTGLGAITVNMWVIIPPNENNVFLYKSDANSTNGWFVEYGDNVATSGQNGFGFSAVSNGSNLRYYINKSQIPTGSWVNLAVTWDGVYPNTSGTGVRIYVNSVLNTTTTYTYLGDGTHLPDTSAEPLSFGKSEATGDNTTGYYSGSVGIIMIYNRALSASEVSLNYNAFKSRYGL